MGRIWDGYSGRKRVNMATLGYVKGRRKWRVRWCATNRKTHYKFVGSRYFFEKHQAIQFYADIEAQEKLVRTSEVRPAEAIGSVKDDFFRHIKKYTSRTRQHYMMVIKGFLAGLPPAIVRIHQIDAAHIREYLYRLRDTNRTNRTLNAHLTAVKSFCRYYSEQFKLVNPAAAVSMLTEDPPKRRFVTYIEYKKLLAAAGPAARARIIFLANTGLRASEFASITVSNLNHDCSAVTIDGKGRKRRTVPLNRNARSVIPALKICSKNALYLQFTRLAKKAGIPSFGPHALRHYFATQMLLAGVPIAKVSRLLGHKSIKTTEQCYNHILSTDLANVTDVLDDLY
jgi:site-specific recombinase XerD